MIAAFYTYTFRTWYVSIPIIALIAFAFAFVLLGAIYGGGGMRGETYAGCLIALAVVFAIILAATAGLYFFLRVTHRIA